MEAQPEPEQGVCPLTSSGMRTYPWNPMTNWQGGWASRCERLCCHTCGDTSCDTWRCGSGPCADIGCDGCGLSIVRPLPPDHRYVCLDCLDEGGAPSSVDFCDECFAQPEKAHADTDGSPHLRWLRIDGSSGAHTEVVRESSRGVDVKEVVVGDLVVLREAPEGSDAWVALELLDPIPAPADYHLPTRAERALLERLDDE